jgi:prepilin signal peptidase PulO-like enzyme (type II secretory pathway)
VVARFGSDWAVPAYLALFRGLLALSWIDVEWMVLPRAIVYPVSALMGVLLLMPAGAHGAWHSYGVAWGSPAVGSSSSISRGS